MPLDSARWREIERLFAAAADLEAGQRTSYLDQACADADVRREVESLLASDRARDAGFIAERVASAAAAAVSTPPVHRRVGPYELLREIGRGGMGTVYLARRADEEYDTQVAIKLVRPGMDTDFLLMRFRRERQILASFQHPNIARLLDGGTTAEGLPYIVMEYIDGRRISEYVEDEALTLDSRIRLFLAVCDAVEYAHRRFVVHRDLKPGNILVDASGAPKLLDFGICKLLYSNIEETATGASPMTPDYASPEQVRGDPVTIASDIYSLGAVLYELLTGSKPHRIERYTPRGVEQAICEQPTLAPSAVVRDAALRRRLSGDLDNILLRAMHKEPERRYGSAAEFAGDLRRYLEHLPVQARPDSLWYRCTKFVHRHLILCVAFTVACAGLVAAAGIAWREAQRERQRALETRQLAGSLLVDVHDALRDAPGATRARRMLVESALGYLNKLSAQSAHDPALRRELIDGWTRLGDAQGGTLLSSEGDMRAALESYERALALAADGGEQLLRIALLRRIGNLEAYTRSPREALARYQQARELGLAIADSSQPGSRAAAERELAEVLMGASRLERLSGEPSAALESAMAASRITARLHAAADNDTEALRLHAGALNVLGMARQRLGEDLEAIEHYRQAIALLEPAVETRPAAVSLRRELMLAWMHTGDALRAPRSNDLRAAREAFDRVAAIGRALVAADPNDMRARNEYGNALSRAASLAEGARRRELYQEAREQLAIIAAAHPDNRSNLFHLSVIEERLGDAAHAQRNPGAARHWWTAAAGSAARAAEAAAAQSRPEEAARLRARSQSLATRLEPAR